MKNWRCLYPLLTIAWPFALCVAVAALGQNGNQHPSFDILTHRMDVDVDGAPDAYGPPGKRTLDILQNAHYLNRDNKEIVGYLVDEQNRPILTEERTRKWDQKDRSKRRITVSHALSEHGASPSSSRQLVKQTP